MMNLKHRNHYDNININLYRNCKYGCIMNIPNKEWLTVPEVVEFLDISPQAVRKKLSSGKYETRIKKYDGRKPFEVKLSSIIENMSDAQKAEYYNKVDPKKLLEFEEQEKYETEMSIYSNAPAYQRKQADKYIAILTATEGLKGNKLKQYITNIWNVYNPHYKTSYPRVAEARKIFNEQGITGLLSQYGKTAGKSKINENDYEYFKSVYLKEGKPTLQSCWLETYGNHMRINAGVIPEDFPSASTFRRLLEKRIPESYIYYVRCGEKAWNKKYSMYINRDASEIKPGQLWVSDHRQVDQAVICNLPKKVKNEVLRYINYLENKEKRPVFPWLTVWRDFKTNKWLGWVINPVAPCSDQIFMSFYIAAEKYGLPEEIYIDNGKDYRSKDFAGGKKKIKIQVDEIKTQSMMGLLGITVHFSKPYNGQSKPLERDFRNYKDWLDKQMPGYRGGNIVERPEKLTKEIKQGKILDYDIYSDLLNYFILNVINKYESEGKNLLGRSPDQMWNEEIEPLKTVSTDALKMFAMRSSGEKTIGRNGITVCKKHCLYYAAEWMFAHKGRKVYMRRAINKYQEAWVFDAKTHEYLGKGIFNAWDSAAIAKTDMQKEQLDLVSKAKANERKIAKMYTQIEERDPKEIIENLVAGIAVTSKNDTPEERSSKSNVVVKTYMDDVLTQDEIMEKEGTYDVDYTLPIAKKSKRKIYLFKTDKELEDNQ